MFKLFNILAKCKFVLIMSLFCLNKEERDNVRAINLNSCYTNPQTKRSLELLSVSRFKDLQYDSV